MVQGSLALSLAETVAQHPQKSIFGVVLRDTVRSINSASDTEMSLLYARASQAEEMYKAGRWTVSTAACAIRVHVLFPQISHLNSQHPSEFFKRTKCSFQAKQKALVQYIFDCPCFDYFRYADLMQ